MTDNFPMAHIAQRMPDTEEFDWLRQRTAVHQFFRRPSLPLLESNTAAREGGVTVITLKHRAPKQVCPLHGSHQIRSGGAEVASIHAFLSRGTAHSVCLTQYHLAQRLACVT